MSCCGPSGCNQKESLLAVPALVALAGESALIVNKLLEVAAGVSSLVYFVNSSPELKQLAEKIESLVQENELLRKKVPVTPNAAVTSAGFTVTFGPKGNYELTVPLGDHEQRQKLAAALDTAANHIAQLN